MGFRINTNVAAMNAHNYGVMNNRELDSSLSKLSSGLRINTAADDASGMSIADSLKSQASALGQAIRNSNDAIGIIQTADKAMDEQIKILDTIKVKATQAAQDGQSALSRQALQNDIVRLLEELDNIATTTSFNGMSLLAGAFTNKEFQIGAYSNQTVRASIGATSSDKIGSVRYESTTTISSAGTSALVFSNPDGTQTTLQGVIISNSAGTGLGVLAEAINKAADSTGVRASYRVVTTGSAAVAAGDIRNLRINGITIGDVLGLKSSDSNGNLINAINAVTHQTGVYASIDIMGRLNLTSTDGRGIEVQAGSAGGLYEGPSILGLHVSGAATAAMNTQNYGRLTLTTLSSKDIVVSDANNYLTNNLNSAGIAATVNLRDVRGNFLATQGVAAGAYANKAESGAASNYLGSGVTTRTGAMMVMDIAESAMKLLDKIRADMGSVQQQLIVTINNISTTQVSVTAAESQIRDVDFAEESANFSKRNILAQSGSFAMAQANTIQQNVLKLLQ
ncbi:MAG: flagellin B [Campylobacterales bacterium]|nr:flagellin B [Campylobacterales bacterium]